MTDKNDNQRPLTRAASWQASALQARASVGSALSGAAASPWGQVLQQSWPVIVAFGLFVLIIGGLFLADWWTP